MTDVFTAPSQNCICKCGRVLHSKNRSGECRWCRIEREAKTGRPRRASSEEATRICLKHGGPFLSEGPHNRICSGCKASDVWQSGTAGDFSKGHQAGQRGHLSSWW